tara:strand:- start:239 stop:862 length:624 start_codon:yes stop_codon:yes gene_type:complete
MKVLFKLILSAILFASCNQNPKACLELEDNYEVGREYQLRSCSDNHEFITWDFGADKNGFIGDSVPHIFQDVGNRNVTIEAFSRGAYNSDVATQQVLVTRRKIDFIEIVGVSDYTRFTMEYESGDIIFSENTVGTFTDESPFVGQIWGDRDWVLPMDPIAISLEGRKNSNTTVLINKVSKNYRYVLDNPSVYEGSDIVMKLYWRFED